MRSSPVLRFLPMAILLIAGAALAAWAVPREAASAREHLSDFPNSEAFTLQLRPYVIAALCLLPALGALCFAFAGTLDRYLICRMLAAVGICTIALFAIWILLDLNDNITEFRKVENSFAYLVEYYSVVLPYVFVLLIPFALMLGMLYCLGKLSSSREIIAMIQTGRGLARVLAPFAGVGFFLSIACLLLNYHRAPWGEGYQKALIEYAQSGSASQARNVLYHHRDSGRAWFVSRFPYDYTRGQPLRGVQITTKNDSGLPARRLKASRAVWHRDSRTWNFHNAVVLDLEAEPMPVFTSLPSPHVVPDWPETPNQIIKPGLVAQHLGIPELRSWLDENRETEWVDRRVFLTQWYYRWAQPWICLVVVLLAAPLGIVFTRRGAAGGVAIAVFLSASMLLVTEFSLTLGDAGYLPPQIAAWGTNIIFAALALFLLYRRLHGRPIYQSLKNLFPGAAEAL